MEKPSSAGVAADWFLIGINVARRINDSREMPNQNSARKTAVKKLEI
jgi:hypothetical protein